MARNRPSRRTPAEWAIRSGLALLAMVIASVSVAHSLAPVIVDANPAQAHVLDPGNGRIAAQLARFYFLEDQNRHGDEIARLARSALRHDPTAVQAAATLGYQAQMQGNPALARRWLDYAQSLSRRDLLTQLWFVEDAVARGAIPEALRHYDIALRTSKAAPDILFPVLASAVAEPVVRANLAGTLAQNPPWRDLFLRFAADNADPHSIADLYRRLIARGVLPPSEASRIAMQRLVDGSEPDDAWALYTSIHPRSDRHRSRDPRFSTDPATASLFDWVLVNDGSISTSIEGGVFDFAVPSGVGGVMLRQTQLLTPGRYRLEGHATVLDQPVQTLPYWTLSCLNGQSLGQVAMINAAQGGRFGGEFVVPVGCPVQILALSAHPSDDITGVSGRIDYTMLTPLGER